MLLAAVADSVLSSSGEGWHVRSTSRTVDCGSLLILGLLWASVFPLVSVLVQCSFGKP